MTIYRCRFLPESGDEHHIDAATDIEAIATAHGMFTERKGSSGFELWAGKRSVHIYTAPRK